MNKKACLVLLTAALTGCSGAFGGFGGGLSGNCGGDLGASEAAHKVGAFLDATGRFVATADDLSSTLLNECNGIAHDLGVPDSELAPSGDAPAVKASCERVARALRDEFTAIRGAQGVSVSMRVVPPVCRVSLDASANCYAKCDATVTPGSSNLRCTGGELRGQCSAQCTGRCAAEINGQCNGKCEGSCSGSTDAGGRCNGTCQGTCEVSGQASCQGECRGGCSVAYTEPKCTGTVEPPRVDADCQASCRARLSAEAECTKGYAELVISAGNLGDLQARADRLKMAIRNHVGTILSVKEKLGNLKDAAQALVNTGRDVPQAAANLGAGVAICATNAVSGLARAAGSVSVSVNVSVSVSASASASAGKP